MAEIRDVSQIAKKWVTNSSNAAPNYQTGVQNPRRSWQAATIASDAAYKAGVQDAIAKGRFIGGVRQTADSFQQQMAATKGTERYPGGVAAAESRYAQRFAPYAEVIKATTLPPRGARGALSNLERVKTMSVALNSKRLQLRGGS